MQETQLQERAAIFLDRLDSEAIRIAAPTVAAIKAIRSFDDAVMKEIIDALFIRASENDSQHSDALHEIAEVIEEGFPTLDSITGDFQ